MSFSFDELTNRQAVMHYSRHRLMASMSTLLLLARNASTNGQWARCACPWSVRQKLNHVSSVQFIYVALYTSLNALAVCMLF